MFLDKEKRVISPLRLITSLKGIYVRSQILIRIPVLHSCVVFILRLTTITKKYHLSVGLPSFLYEKTVCTSFFWYHFLILFLIKGIKLLQFDT